MWQSEQASKLQMVGRISSGQIKIFSFFIGIFEGQWDINLFIQASLSKLVARSNSVIDVTMLCIVLMS
jgi:hypothetical protein